MTDNRRAELSSSRNILAAATSHSLQQTRNSLLLAASLEFFCAVIGQVLTAASNNDFLAIGMEAIVHSKGFGFISPEIPTGNMGFNVNGIPVISIFSQFHHRLVFPGLMSFGKRQRKPAFLLEFTNHIKACI